MNVSYTNSPQGPFSNGDVTFNPNPATAPGRVSTTLFTGGSGIVGRNTGRPWGTDHDRCAGVVSRPGFARGSTHELGLQSSEREGPTVMLVD